MPDSLAYQHLGITFPSIIRMLDTIQHMSHKARIAYGDYNLTYGRDTIHVEFRHFMMGIYQVNGSAPQLWSIISSILFSELHTKGFGTHFVNSFTTEISQSST